MKRIILFCTLVLLASAAFVLTSCGNPKETLHIYNWGDYISDDVIRKFEKEFNCKVKVDVFDSNEAMYAKLKAARADTISSCRPPIWRNSCTSRECCAILIPPCSRTSRNISTVLQPSFSRRRTEIFSPLLRQFHGDRL